MIPNNDHLPFCCQDAVGNFSETSRLSVLHWTFPLDLCAFLANNFVRASEYAMLLSTVTLKSLTGIIIPFFVLFFRSKISHTRWKISLQETTLLLTSGLSLTAGQRKSVLWSLERLVDFVFCCLRSLFFEDWSHILKGTMKIPSPEWSSKVLLLYRQILKRGKSLKYTDYDFFRRTIRREFEQQRDEVEIKVIKEQYEVLSHQFWNSSTVLLFWTLHHLFMFFLVNPHLIYGVHVHACHTLHPGS